jgi:hypothetical protein
MTSFKGLFRKKSCVDATINDPSTALTSDAAYFIAAKCVASMNADADNIAGMYGFGNDLF